MGPLYFNNFAQNYVNGYLECKRNLQGLYGSVDVVICSKSLFDVCTIFAYNASGFCKDDMDRVLSSFLHNLCSIHSVCGLTVQFKTGPSFDSTIEFGRRAINRAWITYFGIRELFNDALYFLTRRC